MLPKKLAEVKAKLLSKSYSQRTTDEDQLLAELEALDKALEPSGDAVRKVASESITFADSRMTTAPSGRCSCCGR